MTDKHPTLAKLHAALLDGDGDLAVEAIRDASDKELTIDAILTTLKDGLQEVGEKYQSGEYFLPELVLAGKAAQDVLDVLSPRLASESSEFLGTIVLGTVQGDIHDLGKTIVRSMLSGAGFRVYDIGVDVSAAKFIDKAREVNANIIAASALLSMATIRMKDIEVALTNAGLKGKVKFMIGGAAVTPQYAEMIGADGYGKDAFEAVTVAKSLLA